MMGSSNLSRYCLQSGSRTGGVIRFAPYCVRIAPTRSAGKSGSAGDLFQLVERDQRFFLHGRFSSVMVMYIGAVRVKEYRFF